MPPIGGVPTFARTQEVPTTLRSLSYTAGRGGRARTFEGSPSIVSRCVQNLGVAGDATSAGDVAAIVGGGGLQGAPAAATGGDGERVSRYDKSLVYNGGSTLVVISDSAELEITFMLIEEVRQAP